MARLEAEGETGPIEKVKPISKEQALHVLIARQQEELSQKF